MKESPDRLKAQEMCDESVRIKPYLLELVSNHLKT